MKVIVFLISLALFCGGLYIMGNAFYLTGFEAIAFFGGILACCLGIALPVHILKRIDG